MCACIFLCGVFVRLQRKTLEQLYPYYASDNWWLMMILACREPTSNKEPESLSSTSRAMPVTMHNSCAGGLCKNKLYSRSEKYVFQKLFLLIQDSLVEFCGLYPVCVHICGYFPSFGSNVRIRSRFFSSEKKNNSACLFKTTMDAVWKKIHPAHLTRQWWMYLTLNPSSIYSQLLNVF